MHCYENSSPESGRNLGSAPRQLIDQPPILRPGSRVCESWIVKDSTVRDIGIESYNPRERRIQAPVRVRLIGFSARGIVLIVRRDGAGSPTQVLLEMVDFGIRVVG